MELWRTLLLYDRKKQQQYHLFNAQYDKWPSCHMRMAKAQIRRRIRAGSSLPLPIVSIFYVSNDTESRIRLHEYLDWSGFCSVLWHYGYFLAICIKSLFLIVSLNWYNVLCQVQKKKKKKKKKKPGRISWNPKDNEAETNLCRRILNETFAVAQIRIILTID